jgi:hypothetical protein
MMLFWVEANRNMILVIALNAKLGQVIAWKGDFLHNFSSVAHLLELLFLVVQVC